MKPILKKEMKFLHRPLNGVSRILILIGSLSLVLALLFPLWRIQLYAPQYQEGLALNIYAYQIEGGNQGQDLKEINNLNHYIGMRPIREKDFSEMKWVPFALGIFLLLGLRAAVHGQMSQLVDLGVLFLYFILFSMGSFYYRLYTYGHELDPTAPMTIDPFTPILIGRNQIANFVQWSFPLWGTFFMTLFPVSLVVAGFLSRKEEADE